MSDYPEFAGFQAIRLRRNRNAMEAMETSERSGSARTRNDVLPPVNNISDTEDMDDDDSDSQQSVRFIRTARRRLRRIPDTEEENESLHVNVDDVSSTNSSYESSIEEGRIANIDDLRSTDTDSVSSFDSELTINSDHGVSSSPGNRSDLAPFNLIFYPRIDVPELIDPHEEEEGEREHAPNYFETGPNVENAPLELDLIVPDAFNTGPIVENAPLELDEIAHSEAHAEEALVIPNNGSESCNSAKLKDESSQAQSGPSSSSCFDKEDEGQTCSICFELWSNSGEHRLSSLKCGHIFGKSCIERWLKGTNAKCPQCNAKASKKDIRVLYAKALKVIDTSEKDRLAEELSKVKREMANLEREKARQVMKNELDNQLIRKLQEELRMLKASIGSSSTLSVNDDNRSQHDLKIAYYKTFNLVKDGASRVMAFNEWMNMLVVSIKSQIGIFPGFGIKKINVLDMRPERYVHLHSKEIRDLAFNPEKRDLLLSVSMDKTVKITNVSNNAIVNNYVTNQPLWSCCWNVDKSSEFFVGTATGSVHHFDIKNTTEPLTTYEIKGAGPVVSLSYVPLNQSSEFYYSGLLVTRLTSISFVEILDGNIKEHSLPIEGPFVHTAFDPQSRHFFTTCRPTRQHLHARHILCQLHSINISLDPTVINNVISTQEIHVFKGSTTMKVLTRSCLISNPNSKSKSYALFSEESNLATKLFDLSSASQTQILKTTENVIDIIPVKTSQCDYVALLDGKNVRLYKWIEQL